MILVISDVHLGYGLCNREAFSEFLDGYLSVDLDHMVILGDLFDFWRGNTMKS